MYGIKEHHYSGVETMFGFMRKKKQDSLPELPPPPSPGEFPMPEGDIPSIQAPEMPENIEAPEFPSEEAPAELSEIPEPKMPEIPMPKAEEMAPFEEHEEPMVPDEEQATISAMPELSEEEEMPIAERETVRKPVEMAFVSVDEYRNIMDHSNRVRTKLDEADGFVHRLSEIKADEEKAFDKWRAQLEEIERKLGQIDRVIAKAKR